jgi:hypothetical protein
MKIAILISGHLRNYEKCYYNLKINLLDLLQEHDIDIFFHTWNTINYTIKDEISEEEKKKIIKLFNPKKYEFEDDLKTRDKIILNKNFNNLNLLKYCYNSNSIELIKSQINQYYGRYKANLLKKEYERETNITYDFVVSTRFDVCFLDPISADYFYNSKNTILCPVGHNLMCTYNNKKFVSCFNKECMILTNLNSNILLNFYTKINDICDTIYNFINDNTIDINDPFIYLKSVDICIDKFFYFYVKKNNLNINPFLNIALLRLDSNKLIFFQYPCEKYYHIIKYDKKDRVYNLIENYNISDGGEMNMQNINFKETIIDKYNINCFYGYEYINHIKQICLKFKFKKLNNTSSGISFWVKKICSKYKKFELSFYMSKVNNNNIKNKKKMKVKIYNGYKWIYLNSYITNTLQRYTLIDNFNTEIINTNGVFRIGIDNYDLETTFLIYNIKFISVN